MIPCRFCQAKNEGVVIGETNICPDCLLIALEAAMELNRLRDQRYGQELSRSYRWHRILDRLFRPLGLRRT
jgi:hypothetical protein